MAVGDLFSVRFKFNVATHPASFVLHYRMNDSYNDPGLDYCGALDAALRTEMESPGFFLASDVTFEGWEIRKITGIPAAPALSQLANQVGARPGQALPLTKAVVVGLNQSTGGAKRNGRVYLPGISENDTAGNLMEGTQVMGFINTYFNAGVLVDTNFGGQDWEFSMTVKEGIPASQGPRDWPVTSCSTRSIIYNQRRRVTNEWGTVPD